MPCSDEDKNTVAMPNDDIPSQIAELEASLAQPLPKAARRLVEQQLATLRHQRAALVDLSNAQIGDVSTGDVAGRDALKGSVDVSGAVQGAAVGVNQGVVINASALPPSPDATQLRLLRAIAEQTGGSGKRISLSSMSLVAEELGLTLQDVAGKFAILENRGYVKVKEYLGGSTARTIALTPAALDLLRSLSE